jgi:HKD family nuclease
MKITHLSAQATGTALKRLMREYDHFHWAVAWATETAHSQSLLQHHKKIAELVVGTDFDHTSPKLLRKLLPLKTAHVAASKSGATFHPKVYGFVSGQKAAVLVGSSNFTNGGTHTNQEASLLLEGALADQPIKALLAEVTRWWKAGEEIEEGFLEAYERRCAASKQHRDALKRKLFVPNPKPDAKHPRLLSLSWKEYVAALAHHGVAHRYARVQVLRQATEIFASANSFANISPLERKALAGFIGSNEVNAAPHLAEHDWGWFGSMKGAGVLKNRVTDKSNDGKCDRHLSAALDCIAPTGAITEVDYRRFVELFRKAFTNSAREGRIASASRLLAMKRPDYFVCIDKENRRELSRDLGFASSALSFETYWDLVVEPVMTATWWQASRPSGAEGHIWDGRAAMLDALYFVPQSVAPA